MFASQDAGKGAWRQEKIASSGHKKDQTVEHCGQLEVSGCWCNVPLKTLALIGPQGEAHLE